MQSLFDVVVACLGVTRSVDVLSQARMEFIAKQEAERKAKLAASEAKAAEAAANP